MDIVECHALAVIRIVAVIDIGGIDDIVKNAKTVHITGRHDKIRHTGRYIEV